MFLRGPAPADMREQPIAPSRAMGVCSALTQPTLQQDAEPISGAAKFASGRRSETLPRFRQTVFKGAERERSDRDLNLGRQTGPEFEEPPL